MAYQDFSTYTVIGSDASPLTIGDNDIVIADIVQSNDAVVYKDFNEGFLGNLTAYFEVTVDDGSNSCIIFGLDSGAYTSTEADSANTGISVRLLGTRIYIVENVGDSTDLSVALSFSTKYYLQFVRESSSITLYIRTGSHSGTLVDTLTLSGAPTTTYRYLTIFASQELGASGETSATIENYTIEYAGYGYEDFNTFTQEGTFSGSFAIDHDNISFDLSRTNTKKVWRNFGSNYFAGNESVRFKLNISSQNNHSIVIFGLDNSGNTFAEFTANRTGFAVYTRYVGVGVHNLGVQNMVDLSFTSGVNMSLNTDYYITIERDDSGNLTILVESGSFGGTQVGTISKTVPSTSYSTLTMLGALAAASGSNFAGGTISNLQFGPFDIELPEILTFGALKRLNALSRLRRL